MSGWLISKMKKEGFEFWPCLNLFDFAQWENQTQFWHWTHMTFPRTHSETATTTWPIPHRMAGHTINIEMKITMEGETKIASNNNNTIAVRKMLFQNYQKSHLPGRMFRFILCCKHFVCTHWHLYFKLNLCLIKKYNYALF